MQGFEFNKANEKSLLAWLRKWRLVYALLLIRLVGAFSPIYTMEKYRQHIIAITEETEATINDDYKRKIQLYAKNVGGHHPIITWISTRSAAVMLSSFILLISCVIYANMIWKCPYCHKILGRSHLSGPGLNRALISEAFAKKMRDL